ncbi:MAG TPA: DUF1254 domain-containing protein [Vicinamibacterales bacterium]|nr:DUF1254 domain-containing protein [Vicinamibacterales bacterium]
MGITVATAHGEPVTVDNFNRAETDRYFASSVVLAGGTGRFHHRRELMPIDKQTVVRANRDTLYSSAVFDLDAGDVTVMLPDAGRRFMSMLIIDEDQFAPSIVYGAGRYTLTGREIGTRYAMAGVRTLVDPGDPHDLAKVHALQDAIRVEQKSPGRFDVPAWDQASQKSVRDALIALGVTVPDSKRMFGPRDQVDPVRHLIGTAIGWGGNPEEDATYLNVTPRHNDGRTIYRLIARRVPVDGFWSISVYNAEGYFEPNPHGVYSVNNITATKNADGSVTVQFGGFDGRTPNCVPITPGWNYLVRLYRPRPEIVDGTWVFPQAELVP